MRITASCSLMGAAVLAVASCSDPSAPRTPESITVVSGASQSASVMQELPAPVIVEVADADGRPVRGVEVTWAVARGGGSVSETENHTDAGGRAAVRWTVGPEAGENRLDVVVTGLQTVSIQAIAEAGAARSAAVVQGDGQTGLEYQPLGESIAVVVLDAYGNGVRDAEVTFTPHGGGTVTPQVATTNGAGVAAATWTLGAAGPQDVQVSVAGIEGGALQFGATAIAPSEITELASGVSVHGIAAQQGHDRYFRIQVPENATHLTVSTTGGSGDADLFASHARLPHGGGSACESTSPTTNESCTIEEPSAGYWYVLIDAFSAYEGVTVRAAHARGGSLAVDVTGLPDGADADVMVTGPNRYARRVTSTDTLGALVPGEYAVTAAYVNTGPAVYAASPETQLVDVTIGSAATVAVPYAATSGGINLDIINAYITQSVQRADGSIPLVAGRDGLLRVFARGNAVSDATPSVRARLYSGGTLVQTLVISAPPGSLPVSHDERSLTTTWNAVVPGALIQPGLTLLLDVDPADEVTETNELDNAFPRSGPPLQLDVRPSAPLLARLVPVVQANGVGPDLTAANRDSYTTDAQALFPLQSIDADVRAPYTFSSTLPAMYDSTWQRLLGEINALRVAEAPERYYYGVIKPAYTSGGTGLGYIRQRAAVGVDWPNYRAFTLAHEWGHNFGRYHVDCGGPANPDPEYPHAGGRLGHHGYDIRTNTVRELETHFDLMSYCSPTWASDYTYEAVMSFLTPTGGSSPAAAEPSLLVWGRITPEGAVLEPALEVVATPTPPTGGGAYRISGTGTNGSTVLDMSFDAHEIDHMPGVRVFAFAVPLSRMGGEMPAELRLSGGGGPDARREMSAAGSADVKVQRDGADGVRLQWNSVSTPLLMVRDGRTGEILAFARGGDARVVTAAGELQVHMSNGVRSTMRRFAVPR